MTLAAAGVDRLLRHAHIVVTDSLRGELRSY